MKPVAENIFHTTIDILAKTRYALRDRPKCGLSIPRVNIDPLPYTYAPYSNKIKWNLSELGDGIYIRSEIMTREILQTGVRLGWIAHRRYGLDPTQEFGNTVNISIETSVRAISVLIEMLVDDAVETLKFYEGEAEERYRRGL